MAKLNAKQKLKMLTTDEKILLLSGTDALEAVKLSHYDIYGIKMADGPNGVKTKDGNAICFMNTCLMACSWDDEICRNIGRMLGNEAVRNGVDMLLAPAMNIKRTPLDGRNFEYYSEDPYLTGRLASEYVKGIKETSVLVCAKHFACNNQETNRFVQDSIIDEDTMRNIYLRAFEMLLLSVDVDSIMASYNKVNGEYACEHKHLLKDILRDEWCYDGVVMSDWCAVSDIVNALQNGLDLEMPGNAHNSFEKIKTALQEQRLTEDDLNEKATRLLALYDHKPTNGKVDEVDVEQLVQMTGESFVLLKNDAILPLHRHDKILLIGNAKTPKIQGGGCALLKTNFVCTPYDEICGYASVCDNVDGYDVSAMEDRLSEYDKIIVFLTLSDDCDSEAYDKHDLAFPQEQVTAIEEIYRRNKNIVAVLSNGSAVDVCFDGQVRGILETYYAGSYGARGLARVLYGEITPSGKLMESFPMQLSDIPSPLGDEKQLNVVYSEREFVGYRYYTSYNVATKYPFGFGLSYCDFKIDTIQVTQADAYDFTVDFEVENLSDCFDGKEIVQIYLKSHNRFEPKMRLVAYAVARLKKGEKKQYSLTIDKRDLMHYVGGKKRFYEGTYSLCVATSSANVVYEQKFTLQETQEGPITKETQLGRVLSDARYRPVVLENMQSVINFWAYGTKKAEGNFENEKFLKESIYSMPFRAFAYFDEQLFDDKKMNALIEQLNQIK